MVIDPVRQSSTVSATRQPEPISSVIPSHIKDSLSSAISTTVFNALAFMMVKTLSFFCRICPSFDDLKLLKSEFKTHPQFVIMGMLELIEQNPKKAQAVIEKILEDWKLHPSDYIYYDRSSRKELISSINDVVLQMTLTAEEYNFHCRVIEGDLQDSEAFALGLNDEEWEVQTQKMGEAIKARALYQQITKKQKAFKEQLWGAAYAILLEKHGGFVNSNLESKAKNPFTNKELNFGVLMERFLYDNQQNEWGDFSEFKLDCGVAHNFLEDLKDRQWGGESKEFIVLKPIVEKLSRILSNQNSLEGLWTIVEPLCKKNVVCPVACISPSIFLNS